MQCPLLRYLPLTHVKHVFISKQEKHGSLQLRQNPYPGYVFRGQGLTQTNV